MTVYFVRDGDLVKIGFSNDTEQRVRNIIRGLHGNGEFLGCMPGDREVEAHVHAMFGEDREYGEWFRSSPRLLDLVKSLAVQSFPKVEDRKPSDRLQLQEEKFAEEGAQFLRTALSGLQPSAATFAAFAASTSIPSDRLQGIYHGFICPITAGEYVILRMMQDAALGLTPADYEDAEQAAEKWAKDRKRGWIA